MRKVFFKFFFSIVLVTVSVILIQAFMLMTKYIEGQKKWERQTFEKFSSGLVDVLDGVDNREQLLIRLDGLFSRNLDDRVSGYLLRNPAGGVFFSVGKTPDGRPLVTDGVYKKPSLAMNLVKRINSSDGFLYIIEINSGNSINASGYSAGHIRYSDEFGSDNIPAGIIGTIKVYLDGHEHVLIDLVGFSPMNYFLTGEILTACMRSLVASVFISIFIATCGAFFISRSNAIFIDSVRTALNEISGRKENVNIPNVKNSYLNDIFRMIHSLDLKLQSNARSRRLWLNSISHDLNTPAMSMKVIIDGISDGVFSPDKATIEQLRQENCVLNERIGRVIELSNLQADTVPVIDAVDTSVFCDNVIESFGNEKSRILIETDCKFIVCDCTLMHIACCEFLKNALEYSVPSSSVVWKICGSDNSFTMSFVNEGSLPDGYNAQDMFEPWTRGDWSRSGNGNGLGLPIGGTIIYLHRGNATISQNNGLVTLSLSWVAS